MHPARCLADPVVLDDDRVFAGPTFLAEQSKLDPIGQLRCVVDRLFAVDWLGPSWNQIEWRQIESRIAASRGVFGAGAFGSRRSSRRRSSSMIASMALMIRSPMGGSGVSPSLMLPALPHCPRSGTSAACPPASQRPGPSH